MAEPWGQDDIDEFVANLVTHPSAPGYYLVPVGQVGRFLLELARLRRNAISPTSHPRGRVELTCEHCGVPFERFASKLRPGAAVFCSKACAYAGAKQPRPGGGGPDRGC